MRMQENTDLTPAEMQLHKRMARLEKERRKAAETSPGEILVLWSQPPKTLLLAAPQQSVATVKPPAWGTRLIQSLQKWLMHPLISFRTQEYL